MSHTSVNLANPYKATPSDTLVSGPETSLIACGRAAFLIMSLLVSPYESHYFANEYHYHTYFVPHDHSTCAVEINPIMR